MVNSPIPIATTRPWKVIAAEVVIETNSAKLTQLIEELTRALDEQAIRIPKHPAT